MSGKLQFAPLPVAALSDPRLSASHFRLLGAIAFYDRFSKNGQGCYATHATLGQRARVHPKNIPQLTADLAEWGHIEISRSEIDKRRLVYRVRYADDQIGSRSTTDPSTQDGSQSTTDSPPNSAADPLPSESRSVVNGAKIGSEPKRQVAENNQQSVPIRYSSLRGNRSSEAVIDTAEADRATKVEVEDADSRRAWNSLVFRTAEHLDCSPADAGAFLKSRLTRDTLQSLFDQELGGRLTIDRLTSTLNATRRRT